jgi:hypothetical protein
MQKDTLDQRDTQINELKNQLWAKEVDIKTLQDKMENITQNYDNLKEKVNEQRMGLLTASDREGGKRNGTFPVLRTNHWERTESNRRCIGRVATAIHATHCKMGVETRRATKRKCDAARSNVPRFAASQGPCFGREKCRLLHA